MEYICEHCGSSYLPKRTDARYCSRTCRQEAYVLRKALSGGNLNGTSDEKNEKLSVKTDITVSADKLSDNENSSISVRTDKLSVNDKEEYPSKQDLAVKNLTLAKKKEAVETEYKQYLSVYLEELGDAFNSRNQSVALYQFFSQKIPGAIWVSERYRCLLECLLRLSEMKEVCVDDLKEVCNAFTDLIYSGHFKRLHVQYPYVNEIKKAREQLRKVCIQAGQLIFIKYSLNRIEKQNMILIRFELSQFIRKKPFSELNFKE